MTNLVYLAKNKNVGLINLHTCSGLEEKKRLNVVLKGLFLELPTNAGIKKALKNNRLILNGKVASSASWVQSGDVIELMEPEFIPPKEFKLKLEVIYEDEYMAAVIKLPGYPVSGNLFKSIENALNFNLKKSKEPDALEWPRPVHRLDNPTTGILLISKTSRASKGLGLQFQDKDIQKTYRALVQGEVDEDGVLNEPIEGKESVTEFKRLGLSKSLVNNMISDVALFPKTGRTHQLRIHMASIGHSIIGDQIYGVEGKTLKHKGLFLYAVGMVFIHPISGEEIKLMMNLPSKYQTYIDREKIRWDKFNSSLM